MIGVLTPKVGARREPERAPNGAKARLLAQQDPRRLAVRLSRPLGNQRAFRPGLLRLRQKDCLIGVEALDARGGVVQPGADGAGALAVLGRAVIQRGAGAPEALRVERVVRDGPEPQPARDLG
jgi:hypothetical protein